MSFLKIDKIRGMKVFNGMDTDKANTFKKAAVHKAL